MNPKVAKLCEPISVMLPTGHAGDTRENVALGIPDDEKLPLLAEIESAIEVNANPEWSVIKSNAETILQNGSKHVQLAIYWTVASVDGDGLAGLADGLELITVLHQKFWDDLHPQPTKSGPTERASLLAYLSTRMEDDNTNVAFLRRLQKAALTQSAVHGALTLKEAGEATQQIGTFTYDRLVSALRDSPDSFFAGLNQKVASARASLKSLLELYTEKTALLPEHKQSMAQPGFSALLAELDRVERILRLRSPDQTFPAPASTDPGTTPLVAAGPKPWNRSTALEVMEDVRRFFHKREPSSPVTALVELGLYLENKPFLEVLKRTPPPDLLKLKEFFGEPPAVPGPRPEITEPPTVLDRDEAVMALLAIEELFRKFDPSSPVVFFSGLSRAAATKGYAGICEKIGSTSPDAVRDILIGKPEKPKENKQ